MHVQMDMHVAPGHALSFSSTLGSPPCCASFLLCFLLLSIEQCLSVEVMLKSGAAPYFGGCMHYNDVCREHSVQRPLTRRHFPIFPP